MKNNPPETPKSGTKIPIHSTKLWVVLVLGLVGITALSMLKDGWLTGAEPNIWFYIFVPIVDTIGTAGFMFLFSRLFRQTPGFLEFLAVTIGVAILMQTLEIITKLIYYKVWEYPGWLYLVVVFPFWFIFTTYALVRFTHLKLGMAFLLSVFGFIGSLVIGGAFTEITGLETPGS